MIDRDAISFRNCLIFLAAFLGAFIVGVLS